MQKITFDYSTALKFIDETEIDKLKERVSLCHSMLNSKTGIGKDYLGWVDSPFNYNKGELIRIKSVAEKIRKQSDIFIIVGIGGSYLGARAAIEMLNHNFYNELTRGKRKGPKIYFAGNNMNPTYLNNLLEVIEGQDVSINIISKSGTTIEPTLGFKILKKYMNERYGRKEASKRIYVTTGRNKSELNELASQEGYETFIIPTDIGGRYSVLTSVGLLPMAVAGIDIDEVMEGAKQATIDLRIDNIKDNISYQYAVIRNLLYAKDMNIEILVSYEPSLFYLGEWFKQLFGESEGKDGKGIFPSSLNFTADLHSMGQYIQEGRKNIFETVLNIEKYNNDVNIDDSKENGSEFNYLEGKTMGYVNKKAMEGTIAAHVDGGVPNLIINIPENTPYYFGYLAYLFMKACVVSGYLLEVNPFNQPGVELYKNNMLRLLGKSEY